MAREIGFARVEDARRGPDAWPAPDPATWGRWLERALEEELASELTGVRTRQENRLRRELERVDEYFANYEREFWERARRGSSAKVKLAERLAAARAEHARHRADQVARHEITIVPHVDALLLVAKPAWRAALHVERAHRHPAEIHAQYVPRARRWEVGRREE